MGSWCRTASQAPPSSSAWQSVSARRRCSTQHSHWCHTTCQCWTFQVSWKHYFLRWLPGQRNRYKNQQGKPGAGQTPQPSAQPTQHPAINETESQQCCGSPLLPLRLWNVDTVSYTCQEAGVFPHTSYSFHTRNQLAGPHHQSWGPVPWKLHQHRVHAPQRPTSMGGACNPHGVVSDAKTPDVWRAPARQKKPRPPKTAIQRHRQSQSPVVSHQAERVGGTSHGQTKVESLNPQSCCQLRGSWTLETYCCQR